MNARDAAIQAVKDHPSTTFMAPYESLADAVLAAAAPLIRAETFREVADILRRDGLPMSAGVVEAQLELEAIDAAGQGEKDTTPAATSTPQPCATCAHGPTSHKHLRTWGGPGCLLCPSDETRAWLHPYTGAAPHLDELTARLYDHILGAGGHWTTTSAHRWLVAHVDPATTRHRARHILQHLAGLGYLTEQDVPGRRTYTPNYAKDSE
ncbi:hypothetical protein [Streptomyces flavidovirens]|uniref:hypothetical protein n=1 Tax=Streptomyces flavidovirens TaxID=67298 RepID=UPI0004025642|nr:hypothetical protein [Streptomyces flavidovirens]